MRKFISNQFLKDLPLPSKFQEHFKPVMERLISRQKGSLQEYSSNKENIGSRNLIMTSMLSFGNVRRDVTRTAEDSSIVCCGPHHSDCLGEEFLPSLKSATQTFLMIWMKNPLLAILIVLHHGTFLEINMGRVYHEKTDYHIFLQGGELLEAKGGQRKKNRGRGLWLGKRHTTVWHCTLAFEQYKSRHCSTLTYSHT